MVCCIHLKYILQISKKNKITKNPKNTTYYFCNLYKIQNKHLTVSEIFRLFSKQFKKTNVFWHFCVFCIINWYFEYRIRILWVFLYMGTYFKDICRHPKSICRPPNRCFLQKCEQFSYRGFFGPKYVYMINIHKYICIRLNAYALKNIDS